MYHWDYLCTIGTNVSSNGNIGTNGTIGCRETFRVPWLPMVPLATNGTIGKVSNGTIGRIPNARTIAEKKTDGDFGPGCSRVGPGSNFFTKIKEKFHSIFHLYLLLYIIR